MGASGSLPRVHPPLTQLSPAFATALFAGERARACSITCVGLLLVLLLGTLPLAADVFQMPAGRRSLELVVVGHPGNAADTNGHGAVARPFRISRYEITTAQYVEFLNAKARADADGGLWNNDMDKTRSGPGPRCEIRRSGERGSYQHTVAADYANRPVNFVSFLDACRFCNWLHNGQGEGDTEDGAYTLRGYQGTDGRRIRRNPGARFFIPTDDEWYKAAYFDPEKSGGPGYWRYPTRSNERPGRDFNSSNAANYHAGGNLLTNYFLTEVGAFSNAPSAFGTFDQGGNVYEWTEALTPPFLRGLRGGGFNSDDAGLNLPPPAHHYTSRSDVHCVGFRVAASLPEGPSSSPSPTPVSAVTSDASTRVDPLPDAEFPRRPWRDPNTGRPFFPLAWFSYASDEADLDQLAQEGANLVLFVNAPADVKTDEQVTDSITRMTRYLDHAGKRGIKVLPQVGLVKWHLRGDSAAIDRQRRWTEAIRNHPALLGYQLYDEPEYRQGGGLGVEEQRGLREFVDALGRCRDSFRQWDPNPHRLISVVFNLVPLSSWVDFLPVIDSFQVDRYPLDQEQAHFGHRGDWGPLMMAWSMAHGAAALREHPHLRNPSPCMQGVGAEHTESGKLGVWRNPLYEETRYMAYSSLTAGAWGVFHWIRKFGRPDNQVILDNVGRLYRELRTLIPALEASYEQPPFRARHNHEGISRPFLTDSVPDLTTLTLEDDGHYYLIVSNNGGTFNDVNLRLKGLKLHHQTPRPATVLNEGWERMMSYDPAQDVWELTQHTMVFGDINVWVITKDKP